MRHPRRPAARFVPRIEGLEERRLPAACTITAIAGGTLRIRGTNGNDRIQILDDGTANVNNVIVVCKGQTFLPGTAVTTLDIRPREGNDAVTYSLDGPLQTGVVRTVQVHFGAGHDSFSARLRAGLLRASILTLEVLGGDGGNSFNLTANSDISIAATAQLTAEFSGGAGNDVIQTNYRGQMLGSLNVFAAGRGGDDVLSSQLILTPGSNGKGGIQELGGDGNDTLTLIIERVSLLDSATVVGFIDGGAGFDQAFFSPGVSVARVNHHTVV
jgi:hypothetical protein